MNRLTWLVVLLGICGCCPQSSDYQRQRELVEAMDLLPPKTIVLKELGNRYYVVEIEGRKFLFTYRYGSHSERSVSFTEFHGELNAEVN